MADPDGELRIVGPDGSGADQHRVRGGPQPVGVGPGLLTGDPARRSVGCGDAAVEGGRQLEDDPGPARTTVLQVGGEQLGRLIGGHAHVDLETDGAQRLDAAPRHPGIGIDDAHHHP